MHTHIWIRECNGQRLCSKLIDLHGFCGQYGKSGVDIDCELYSNRE